MSNKKMFLGGKIELSLIKPEYRVKSTKTNKIYTDVDIIHTPTSEYNDYMIKQKLSAEERKNEVEAAILGNFKIVNPEAGLLPEMEMSHLIVARICLSDVKKEFLFTSETSGRVYCDLTGFQLKRKPYAEKTDDFLICQGVDEGNRSNAPILGAAYIVTFQDAESSPRNALNDDVQPAATTPPIPVPPNYEPPKEDEDDLPF